MWDPELRANLFLTLPSTPFCFSTKQKFELVRHEYILAGVGPDGLHHSQVVGDAAVIHGLTSRADFSSEYDSTNRTILPGDISRTVIGSW